MSDNTPSRIERDLWHKLRQVTAARIAMGRSGGSVPTRELLDFQAAHAAARDAVHQPFDAEKLAAQIGGQAIIVDSEARDRATYLQRPDLGRRLDSVSRDKLAAMASDGADLCIIVTDGLSAMAVHRHGAALVRALLPRLSGWSVAPIVVARFGRVALEDDVGAALKVRISLILVGERPGLGSPDSVGAYLVHGPAIGRTDADRNCVSNIRPEGLPLDAAAERLAYLLNQAKRLAISGIALKDDRSGVLAPGVSARNQLRYPAIDE